MTRPPIYIGLTGYAGTGKDTVADLLTAHCGAARVAFADKLRAEVCEAYCIDPEMLTRRETKEHPMSALALYRCLDADFAKAVRASVGDIDAFAPRSPRQIVQWWGTEYRKADRPLYWIDHAYISCCHAILGGAKTIVLPDVRSKPEADAVRAAGGVLWQIKRPGYGAGVGHAGHSSDTDGSAWAPDEVINNGHDIGHLQHLVLSAYSRLRCPPLQQERITRLDKALP